MTIKDVTIGELRRDLSALLDQVRGGVRIRVISKGTLIAEIASPTLRAEEIARVRLRLRGSVTRFERPIDEVVSAGEWEVNHT